MGDDMPRTTQTLGAILLFVGSSICLPDGVGAELVPVGVDRFFVAPGEPAVLRWKTESDKPPRAANYSVWNYHEEPVSTGTALPAENGLLQATLTLPVGYYEIEFSESKQRFGIVAVSASQWQQNALVLRARCRGAATVRVFLWEGDTGTGYLTPSPVIPADGQWYPAIVRFRDLSESTANTPDENSRLDLNRVRRISIGVNSDSRQNVLDVSDVYVVGGD